MNQNQEDAHIALMATEGTGHAHSALVTFQTGDVAEDKSDFLKDVVRACQFTEVQDIVHESHKAIAKMLSDNYILRVEA